MIREVDRTAKFIVQKVVTPKNQLICYQVVEIGVNDSSKIQRFAKLGAAREVIRRPNTMPAAQAHT